MESFERTHLIVERSSKDLTSNEGISCSKNCEEEASSSEIFERRKGGHTSTSGRNIKEPYFNEEDEVFLMETYEVDTIQATKPSYEQIFRMSGKLM